MKTVLHLTTSGTALWQRNHKNWHVCEGVSKSPVWVLTDLGEEGFSEIQIPRIFGNDRQNYVARQLVNRFPDTPFRITLPVRASGTLIDRLAPSRQILLGLDAAQIVNATLDQIASPVAGVWTTSMLLASIGSHPSLPPELFIVLPSADALRIVFLKNRSPVLSRLIPGATDTSGQAAEIIRTLRHLENTRVLERTEQRYSVLLLGDSGNMAEIIRKESLDLVPPPPGWTETPTDMRFALFDFVVKSPAGQIAPLSRRTQFIAGRLRKPAYTLALVSLITAFWAGSDNLNDALASRARLQQTQNTLNSLLTQKSEIDQKISAYGVPVNLVNQAILLEQNEMTSAPSMPTHMRLIAQMMGQHEELRLSQFEWRILPASQPPCSGSIAKTTVAATPVPPATTPQRIVEVTFTAMLLDEKKEIARLPAIASISKLLAQLDGAILLEDPSKGQSESILRGGENLALKVNNTVSWCMTLPGQLLKKMPPHIEKP